MATAEATPPTSLQLEQVAWGEVLRRKTDGASQFIGNSLQNSVVLESLTFPPLIRSRGSQDPNLSLATYTCWLGFRLWH
ncbi:hypothetical protein [Nostoc sp. JL33]|uniref:hypothetical protein n=1 Tax=Nostoc sp. JL33 TaxID=2815396 RepID=UPI0025D8C547|nr:hypothetical protein [Nostoc sp. JL33]MBN3873438.1 hypothetical protein [Nostoc sp. JL33]